MCMHLAIGMHAGYARYVSSNLRGIGGACSTGSRRVSACTYEDKQTCKHVIETVETIYHNGNKLTRSRRLPNTAIIAKIFISTYS